MAEREERALHPYPAEEPEAHALAARMPALFIEAQHVAHTVTHGTHGRRRAGPGETFWQFRHYDQNDARAGIDWRRSAISDHLFVREDALAALDAFGASARRLRELADFIVLRKF